MLPHITCAFKCFITLFTFFHAQVNFKKNSASENGCFGDGAVIGGIFLAGDVLGPLPEYQGVEEQLTLNLAEVKVKEEALPWQDWLEETLTLELITPGGLLAHSDKLSTSLVATNEKI